MHEGLIYVIIDRGLLLRNKKNIFKLTEEILKAKPDFIQFRFKNTPLRQVLNEALKMRALTKYYKATKFIINDRVDLAKAVKASGVHLGNDDLPVVYARKILGKRAIIGKTVHCLTELKKAVNEPLNYISIGPVFKTSLKPDLNPLGIKRTKKLVRLLHIPIFVIGGINPGNVTLLTKAGINNIALSSSVILSDNACALIKKLRELIRNS